MRRLYPFLALFGCLLVGCDNSSQTAIDKLAVAINSKNVASPAHEVDLSLETTETLQQRAYTALAAGELLAVCQQGAAKHAFEEAVCRQQAKVALQIDSASRLVSRARNVLEAREDKRNPWQWLVASETCWSADCAEAQQSRAAAKRCGAPVPNALQGQCIQDEALW